MNETDVFISYKREDRPFALELKFRLEGKDYQIWIDQDIEYGREWRREINSRLENTLLVVVVTSKASMTSAYVTYEWCYACLAHEKDFHWIQIEQFEPNHGMFGLLMDKRQTPFLCNTRTPSEIEWEAIISSIETRLIGIKEIRQAGRILSDLHKTRDEQKEAAERLGQVTNQFHKPLALQILLEGLLVHTRTTGYVSGPIVTSLWKLADLSAIPYLIAFLKQKHEDDIDNSAKELIDLLVARSLS
jgi:hypothetical protein